MNGDDSIEYFISALENETRREILRRLILDKSYALEMSRSIGVSQQAINKHLIFLENAKLIVPEGFISSSMGAKRKVYKPTGFSTLIIDYSRNFFDINRYDLDFGSVQPSPHEKDPSRLFDRLSEISRRLDDLMKEREVLIKEKDRIIENLSDLIDTFAGDQLTRRIMREYLESRSIEKVSQKLSIPAAAVEIIIDKFLQEIRS